jgi:hypothetical protein
MRMDLIDKGGKLWTGFMWFSVGTSGRPLQTVMNLQIP